MTNTLALGTIDLTDTTAHYVTGGPANLAGLASLRDGVIELPIHLTGASPDVLATNRRKFEAVFDQIDLTRPTGAYGEANRVYFKAQLSTTDTLYVPVLGGKWTQFAYLPSLVHADGILRLSVLPCGYGTVTALTPAWSSPANVNSYGYWSGVKGDAGPGLRNRSRFLLTDASGSSKIIQRLRLGHFRLPSLTTSQYTPIPSLSPVSPGTAVTSSDSASGTYVSGTIAANADWVTLASMTVPASYNHGQLDVWLRNRVPSATLPTTPGTPTGSPATWFSVIQSASNNAGGAGASVSSVAVTFAQASKAGRTLVAGILFGDETATGVNNAGSNFLVADTSQRTSGPKVWLLYWPNADSVTSETFTVSGASANRMVAAMAEIDHVPTASFDQHASTSAASGTGVNSGTTPFTSQAYEYLIGVFGTKAATTFTAPGGWTELEDRQDNVTSSQYAMELAWIGATTAGAKSGTATAGSSAANAGAIASFLLNGGLASGSYRVCVVGTNTDGSRSVPGGTATFTVTAAQYVPLAWTGNATQNYRLYVSKDNGPWYVVVTPTADTTYNLYTLSGASLESPPTTAVYQTAQLRLRVGPKSGVTLVALPPVVGKPSAIGWNWSQVGSAADLAPIFTQQGQAAQEWYLEVQAKGTTAGSVDLDCAPGLSESCKLAYRDQSGDYTLASKVAWDIDFRDDGRASCILRKTLALTASGNEITDTTRNTAAEGDGQTYPDSTVGIWRAVTSLCTNGGFESNTTDWSALSGAGIAQSSTQAKFGTYSMRVTPHASNANSGVIMTGLAVSGATAYSYSTWLYATAGESVKFSWDEYTGAAAYITSQQTTVVATGGWQRVTLTATTDATAATIDIAIQSPTAGRPAFYVDGIQVEASSLPTPYDASGARSAARLRVAVGSLDETTMSFFVRLRMDHANTALSTGNAVVFQWKDDASNFLELRYSYANARWEFQRRNTTNSVQANVSDTFADGDSVSLCLTCSSSQIGISVDGAAQTLGTGTQYVPTLAATTVDLGSNVGSDSHLNGSVRWLAGFNVALTDAQIATLHGYGNPDPDFRNFPSGCVLFWGANRNLVTAVDPTENGMAQVEGALRLGPDDAVLTVLADVASATAGWVVSDMVNTAFEITPYVAAAYGGAVGTES